MKITSIRQGKRDRERVNIYIDEEFALALDKSTLLKHNLHQGLDITQEELSKISNEDVIQWATRYIQTRWIARPRSRKDFRLRLKMKMQKRYPNLDIEDVWERIEEKLDELDLSDKEYAIWLVQQRKFQKKYGRRYVLSELRSEGISNDVANEVLDGVWGDDTKAREDLLFKKFGIRDLKEVKDMKEKARVIRYLSSRGL